MSGVFFFLLVSAQINAVIVCTMLQSINCKHKLIKKVVGRLSHMTVMGREFYYL